MEAKDHTSGSISWYQDDKYIVLLVKNDFLSGGQNSKHIKHHIFLVDGKVAQKGINICHMDTHNMLVDIVTKSVKAKLFRIIHLKMIGVHGGYHTNAEKYTPNHQPLLSKM